MGSESIEATKLKIRLPKVMQVVESPPHWHAGDPVDLELMVTTVSRVLTLTPLLPAHSATPLLGSCLSTGPRHQMLEVAIWVD